MSAGLFAGLAALALVGASCSSGPRAGAADAAFAAGMVPHHEMGITLDELAVAGADDVRVRRLAFEMNSYQGPELDQLRRWAAAWAGAAGHPSHAGGLAMGMPADDALGRLKASRGPAFDRLFLTLMITHHEGAVSMARAEVASGSVPEAVVLADRVVTVQRQQLAAMRALLAELGPA